MQKIIANIISVIFHPLIMPTLGIFLLFNSNPYFSLISFEQQKIIYYIVIGCTFVLPIIIIPFFIFQSLIKSIRLEEKEERRLPLFITLTFYYFAYYILKKISAPEIIVSYILSCFIAVAVTLLISIKFKISAHLIGIGGVTGFIIAVSFTLMINSQLILMLLILISGLIGYARLRLNAHNPAQVYSGYFLGMAIVLITLMFS